MLVIYTYILHMLCHKVVFNIKDFVLPYSMITIWALSQNKDGLSNYGDFHVKDTTVAVYIAIRFLHHVFLKSVSVTNGKKYMCIKIK